MGLNGKNKMKKLILMNLRMRPNQNNYHGIRLVFSQEIQ